MNITLLLIEYFSLVDVVRCIRSVLTHWPKNSFTVRVVCNSDYPPERQAEICREHPNVEFVFQSNRGYAGGFNAGIRGATADYLLLLNPDSLMIDRQLTTLIDYMTQNPRVALIGPRVEDETGLRQPSCRRFPRWYTYVLVRSRLKNTSAGRRETRRYFMEDVALETPQVVDWVSGGAMLIRAEAIAAIGGMDERYFLYMEDVDLCRSAKQHAWQVVYHPAMRVCHAGKHASLQPGVKRVFSRFLRWHLVSIMKYFMKWKFRRD